jgi:hypothetical protein
MTGVARLADVRILAELAGKVAASSDNTLEPGRARLWMKP